VNLLLPIWTEKEITNEQNSFIVDYYSKTNFAFKCTPLTIFTNLSDTVDILRNNDLKQAMGEEMKNVEIKKWDKHMWE